MARTPLTIEALVLLAASIAAVPVVWLLPGTRAWTFLAAWTAVVLFAIAPLSALWLGAATLGTSLAIRLGERTGFRGAATVGWTLALVAALLSARGWAPGLWVGGAYFTLRNLHVLFEWWMGRLEAPSVARHLRYQFFLPVLVVGPINRLPHFERQCARRRWSPSAFFSGAERALFGLAAAIVLGGWAIGRLRAIVVGQTVDAPVFIQAWAGSVIDWIELYLTFSGFTAVALGVSLMMGLRLEENFNEPWRSRNLIDFWTRWHMTLSFWCRDYVFNPVSALTRSPFIGLAAAMTVIAVWHELSVYYLFWAVWQVLGIVLTRFVLRARRLRAPLPGAAVLGPIGVLAWLSLARPVISIVFGVSQ